MTAYDLSWLRDEAARVYPDDDGLRDSLASACEPLSVGEAYVLFVSPMNANQPGAEWQFERSVTLEDTPQGMVIFDLLKDGRLGGIEFPDNVRG